MYVCIFKKYSVRFRTPRGSVKKESILSSGGIKRKYEMTGNEKKHLTLTL